MEYDRGRVPYGGAAVSERRADCPLIAAPSTPVHQYITHAVSGLTRWAEPTCVEQCIRANQEGLAHLCSAVRVRGIGPTVGHAGGPAERYHDMLNPPSLLLPNPDAKRAGLV
jgi:hypothetical protein